MKFTKYQKIENTYREKTIDYIRMHGGDQGEFCLTEKIHGSNFSFIYDGETMRSAKRTDFIGETENFQSCQSIIYVIKPSIIRLFEVISKGVKGVKEIQVFGEIFGGNYPHEDVKPDDTVCKIQKGVYYCPDVNWKAFDILVTDEEGCWYCGTLFKISLFESCDVPFIKPIFIGTFDDCLEFPCEFESEIYKDYGLPKIENNFAEGFVMTDMESENGIGGIDRVILKKKGDKWSERKSDKKINPPMKFGLDLKTAIVAASRYVNENRFLNVISKDPLKNWSQFNEVLGWFIKDVMTDFSDENKELIVPLSKNERKILSSIVRKSCSAIVREYAKVNL